MYFYAGSERGYDSKIPIESINDFVNKLHPYNGSGTSYGERSASISYNFKKKKTIKNMNYSFWENLYPFRGFS